MILTMTPKILKPSKRKNSFTIIDFYKSYIETVAGNALYEIDYKLFRCILEDYFEFIMDEVFMSSGEFKLPAGLGKIYVKKSKPSRYDRRHMNVDFRETMIQKTLVLHFNEHSSGFRYRFHWEKKEIRVPNISLYEMIFTRYNKRRLACLIKNRDRDYIER